MKWEDRFKAYLLISLMLSAVLILGLSPQFTTAALANSVATTETGNLLLYKNFGEEPTTAPLPAECTENCDQGSTDYYKPEVNPTPSGRSALEEVTTPGIWPYTPTVKLLSHWPSGETTPCSGMLVSALTLITSAQCVYTHQPEHCTDGNPACWVDDLEAIPAYDNGEAPYGESGYETILTWTAWTDAQNSAYDLAAVQLRYPIGAPLGWLGVGFNADDAYFLTNEFTSTSYPEADPYYGESMAGWAGSLLSAESDSLTLASQSDNGQIGASINGANGVAYGVLSNPNAGGNTTFTRITYEKFDAIRTFIEVGQPKAELDLAVFDVHTDPTWYLPGQTLSHLDFYVQNYSSADLPEDTYAFDVYLSEDPLITESDSCLGSVAFTGTLLANAGLRLSFSSAAGLTLPAEIEGPEPNGGIFYVGVLSTLPDSNEENSRSDYYQPEPIWVNDSDNFLYFFPICASK